MESPERVLHFTMLTGSQGVAEVVDVHEKCIEIVVENGFILLILLTSARNSTQ